MFSAAIKSGAVPAVAPADPYFYDVSLLLSGDGTNGAQNNTFLDSSTNNFSITRNGNTTQGSFTPYGPTWSNYVVGANAYLSGNAAIIGSSTSTFTVEAFIYMTSVPTADGNGLPVLVCLDGQAANTTNYLTCGVSTAQKVAMRWYDGASKTCTGSTTIPLNTWAHIAIVVSSNAISMYVNGNLETVSGTTTLTNRSGTSSASAIGSFYYSTFYGYVSNVRISSTARTITVPTAPYVSDANTLVLQSYTNNFTSAGSTSVTWTVGSAGPSVQRFSPFNPTAAYSTSTVGGSGYFDGSGDYLTTPSNVALNISGGGSFTIECWAYLNNNSGNDQNLMIGDNAGSQYWDLRVSGSTLVFRWNNAANSITSNTSWYFGCWNHCAVSWDGTTMRMFVNGILQSSTSTTAIASHTTSVMYIGYSNYAPIPQHPLGYICDTRIVKGSAVYTTTFTPPTAPLTAITNTSLLLNYTNAGIYDSAMMNDLETVSGAKLSTSVKKYGTASISFNGTSDYLQITNSLTAKFGTGDFTIEAWIYKTASQNGAIIDARPSPTAQPWAFSCDASNYPYFYDGGVYTSSIAVSLNTWTHVAVVRSSNVLKIYVNGVQGYSTAYTLTVDGGPSIQIGGPAAFFPGYMDDIRITKGYARYTSSFTPPTAALPNY